MSRPPFALCAFAVLTLALALSTPGDAAPLPASPAVARFDPGDHARFDPGDHARHEPAMRHDPSAHSPPPFARAVDAADWQGDTAPFDRAASGSAGGENEGGKWVTVADRYDPGEHSTPYHSSTSKRAEAEDTPDWQGGGIQMRRAVPGEHTDAQSMRDARFSGGIVYRYGGAIDFDSVAAADVARERAGGARWVPGDDSGVGEALDTVWVG